MVAFTITCRQCHRMFYICRSCYRGQAYCSADCRKIGHEARRRIARKKHAQSPEGKLDHADRNKKYRLKKTIQKIVMDKGSVKSNSAVNPNPQLSRHCICSSLKRTCIYCKAALPEGSIFYERSIQVPIRVGTGPPD